MLDLVAQPLTKEFPPFSSYCLPRCCLCSKAGWLNGRQQQVSAPPFVFSGTEGASAPALAQARDLHFHQVDGLGPLSTPGPVAAVKEYSVLAGLSHPGPAPHAGWGGVHSWSGRVGN